MDEIKVIKNSVFVYLIGLVATVVMGLFFNSISYPIGFTFGYILNLIVFLLIIAISKLILELGTGSVFLIGLLFLIKLIIYGIGFYLAIHFEEYISLVCVFFGYFIIKLSIYVTGYIYKGGEVNG